MSLFGTLSILFLEFLEVVSDIGFVESSGRVKRTRGKLSLVSLASERSERDTIRGNSIEISLYLASERSERDSIRGG